MTNQRITSKHLPKHCIKAPKGFVPHRIKLQRLRKEQALQEQQLKCSTDEILDWQQSINDIESLLADQ